jgi:hypothetical protein
MESWGSNMGIPSLILIAWLFGKLSLEIFQMVLPLLLITSSFQDKLNGKSSQVLCFHFLMVWTVKVQSTVRVELKDFCNFVMMLVMSSRSFLLMNN